MSGHSTPSSGGQHHNHALGFPVHFHLHCDFLSVSRQNYQHLPSSSQSCRNPRKSCGGDEREEKGGDGDGSDGNVAVPGKDDLGVLGTQPPTAVSVMPQTNISYKQSGHIKGKELFGME